MGSLHEELQELEEIRRALREKEMTHPKNRENRDGALLLIEMEIASVTAMLKVNSSLQPTFWRWRY